MFSSIDPPTRKVLKFRQHLGEIGAWTARSNRISSPSKATRWSSLTCNTIFCPEVRSLLPKVIKSSQCLTTTSAFSSGAVCRYYMTRDWHPPNHCSFQEYGGPWPTHCVAESRGAAFSEELKFNSPTTIVSKATTPERECYSDFGTTNFEADLRAKGISRLFVGGLATDYCVFNTVKDALALGFTTFLLRDAIRGVNVQA